MVSYRPINEVIDFIISSPDPQKVLDFRPSSILQNRVEDLVYKKKHQNSIPMKLRNWNAIY